MRIMERLEQLADLGDRIGYSPEEDAAHALAAGWMREAGLDVEVDSARNLIGRVPGGVRRVWTGSHLDTVPGGGRFDGALGVVAGLEVVERLGLQGLAVVAFRDEERGCAGSRAAVERPDAYVELHIEQGPVLLEADAPLGVVTAIVGYVHGRRTFVGTAGHAGTTPMAGRDDALVSAAEFILHARGVASGIEDAVATVGQVAVEPGGSNVIPGRVVVSVDARAPDRQRLDRLAAALEVEEERRTEPSPMSEEVRAVLRDAVAAVGAPLVELPRRASRPRRRHPRPRGRPGRDALRAQPERWHQPQPGRALDGGGHRARRRRARACVAAPRRLIDAFLQRSCGETPASAPRAAKSGDSPRDCPPGSKGQVSRNEIGCAPSHRVRRPSSFSPSAPSTSVAKWFAHSSSALLLKWQ
jgi:allantoate deiminase